MNHDHVSLHRSFWTFSELFDLWLANWSTIWLARDCRLEYYGRVLDGWEYNAIEIWMSHVIPISIALWSKIKLVLAWATLNWIPHHKHSIYFWDWCLDNANIFSDDLPNVSGTWKFLNNGDTDGNYGPSSYELPWLFVNFMGYNHSRGLSLDGWKSKKLITFYILITPFLL